MSKNHVFAIICLALVIILRLFDYYFISILVLIIAPFFLPKNRIDDPKYNEIYDNNLQWKSIDRERLENYAQALQHNDLPKANHAAYLTLFSIFAIAAMLVNTPDLSISICCYILIDCLLFLAFFLRLWYPSLKTNYDNPINLWIGNDILSTMCQYAPQNYTLTPQLEISKFSPHPIHALRFLVQPKLRIKNNISNMVSISCNKVNNIAYGYVYFVFVFKKTDDCLLFRKEIRLHLQAFIEDINSIPEQCTPLICDINLESDYPTVVIRKDDYVTNKTDVITIMQTADRIFELLSGLEQIKK